MVIKNNNNNNNKVFQSTDGWRPSQYTAGSSRTKAQLGRSESFCGRCLITDLSLTADIATRKFWK